MSQTPDTPHSVPREVPVSLSQPSQNSFTAQLDESVRSAFDNHYLDLLDRTINTSRQATIPTRGLFNMSNLQAALPDDGEHSRQANMPYFLRSSDRLERDKRIGAAGELFVSIIDIHLIV